MNDRELLELAAKAYWSGEIDDVVSVEWDDDGQSIIYTHASNQDHNGNDIELLWNPLIDDGDALRMAVKLRITVKHDDPDACCAGWAGNQRAPTTDGVGPWYWKEWNGGDPLAATRRAIVRAAAEIGKAMP